MILLRQGHWMHALADVDTVDALICDPPYSDKTHAGHDDGVNGHEGEGGDGANRQSLRYSSWSPISAEVFVDHWAPRTRGWMVIFTDHILAPHFLGAMEDAGRYVFQPLPIIQKRVRLSGDGPASWCVWLCVSRPRSVEFSRWGCLPGAYEAPTDKTGIVAGAKPLGLMQAIVRDYSKPGDLVCDPCAGGATTLLAARAEGRSAIGAELDPETYAKAQARIAEPWSPVLFT